MKTKPAETKYPPTPELDKMLAVKEESQKIGVFLEWLQEDYVIAEYTSDGNDLLHANIGIEKLLAKYFQIDLNKIENERRAVLDWHRKETAK